MAKVTTTFTSDDKEIVASIEKMNRKLAELDDKNRKLNEESKKGTQDNIGGLRSMLEAMGPVTVATGTIAAGFKHIRDEVQQAVSQLKDFRTQVVDAAREAGDLKNAGRIESELKKFGVPQASALAAFQGVSSGSPMASLDDRLSLAKLVAGQAATGDDLSSLGQVVAQFQDRMPGLTGDNALDLVTKARALAGSNAQQLEGGEFQRTAAKAVKLGALTKEQAVALGLESLSRGETADPIEAALGMVAADIPLTRNTSPEMRQFAKMNPADRLQAILNDPKVAESAVGREQALKLRGFDRGRFNQITSDLEKAQAFDYASQRLTDLQASPAGRDAIDQLANQTTAEGVRVPSQDEMRFVKARDLVQSRMTGFQRFRAGFAMSDYNPFMQFGPSLGIGPGDRADFVMQMSQDEGVISAKEIAAFNAHNPKAGEPQSSPWTGAEEARELLKESQKQTRLLQDVVNSQRMPMPANHAEGR